MILLSKDGIKEKWTTLTGICKAYGISQNYLKQFKFPYYYKGVTFSKTEKEELNVKNGIEFNDERGAIKLKEENGRFREV